MRGVGHCERAGCLDGTQRALNEHFEVSKEALSFSFWGRCLFPAVHLSVHGIYLPGLPKLISGAGSSSLIYLPVSCAALRILVHSAAASDQSRLR